MAFRKGDFGNKVRAIITDAETGSPVNLTGRTAKLIMRLDGITTEHAMTTVDAINGIAEYTFTSGELDSFGDLEMEIVVEEGATLHVTSDREVVDVNSVLVVS